MKFGLSSEQRLLQDSVSRFLVEQAPLELIRQIVASGKRDDECWSGLTDLGIPGILITEANGGLGLSGLDAAIVSELLGHHITPSPFISSSVIAPAALQTAKQGEELLGSVATGETRIGIAFSEGIGARNNTQLSEKGGKLFGKSLFALDATANYYLVSTKDQRIYLVDANARGLSRATLTTIDKTRTICELNYHNVNAKLISDDPNVFRIALDAGLVALSADTLGASQHALDKAVAYAGERKQFNRVIASFQAVKHMCAEMVAHLEPCRSMVWYAAHALSNIPEESTMMASHTKAHLSEVGQFVTRTATEVHGGMGFTDLVGLHYWFKRAGFNRQLLGSPELLRERAAREQGFSD